MPPSRLAGPALAAASAALLLTLLLLAGSAGAADPGAMEAMSIDMDTAGNAATSLGPWDECIVASPGGTLTVDVTATNIPATNPMVGFEFRFIYPAGVITVESADPNFLLAANPDSSLFNLSDGTPDADGDFLVGVADLMGADLESGSGVLDRVTISVSPDAAAGVYLIGLSGAEHIDQDNVEHIANAINNALVAVNTTCENPMPFLAGDVDCNSAVNTVDAAGIMRFESGLPVSQGDPCPDIATSSLGDVDCDSYTNPRDALAILRYVAALPALSSQPGCPSIGERTSGEPYPVPEAGTPTPGPNGYAVSVASAEVEAGGETTVFLHLLAPPTGMGAFSMDVVFDSSLVVPTQCLVLMPSPGVPSIGECNDTFAPDRVRVAGASIAFQGGEADLASITFRAGPAAGIFNVVPEISMMLDPDGNPRTTTAISGSLTIEPAGPTPIPTPTPTPTPTPAPSPVPGGPPPFDPGGVVCFEYLESTPECDGDTSPGTATDIFSKFCIGWNDDCSVKDTTITDSNFGALVSFTPPEWNVPRGDTIPVGALAGRLESEATLGLLNNPCNNSVSVAFTLLNGSINTGDTIRPRPEGLNDVMEPLAVDSNGNGVPDGADKYPAFISDFFAGAQPRERLFGISHIMGTWITVNILIFEPGATLNVGGNAITFDPALGYPAVFILQDPTAMAAPSAISDFCAPFLVHQVVLGATIDDPCTPVRVAGANCPVTSDVQPETVNRGYPALPCDSPSKFDDDGDGKINDGCPQVNNIPETGAQCDNATSDDGEDSAVNDGCPAFGDVSEGARMPGTCAGGDEGGCTQRSNPINAGIATFTTLNASQRDADGDGIENSLDVCALVPNGEWNPRSEDIINDPDNDGLPTACDPSPNIRGNASPLGCRSGYIGADEDQDCFSNRGDNCPLVTQLLDPGLPPNNFPSGGIWNPPLAPDQDADGIGDACDPDPAAPNGDYIGYCLKMKLSVGGANGAVTGVRQTDKLVPECATAPLPAPSPAPAPSPTPTPTPTPGPPIELEVSIDDTGDVVPRDGVATVHGQVRCDRPALVQLEVQVVQRAGRAYLVGVGEMSVWCDGAAEWSIEAVPNGRFVGGWVDVSAGAEAQAGMSHGSDSAEARVRLRGGGGPRS